MLLKSPTLEDTW